MKIICIGRNYAGHAKELKNDLPSEPIFFMKPDSALLLSNRPFYYPDFSTEIHHEVEIVVRINRLGKHIDKKFTHRYYNEIALGIDFTARDLQAQCKKEGKPWEIAKSFDNSAPLSKFISLEGVQDLEALDFHLDINGKTIQKGNTRDMIFNIDEIISYVSRFVTLKIGDLIFTGTPEGVGPVKINDQLTGYIKQEEMFRFMVK